MYKKDITIFNQYNGIWKAEQLSGVDLITDKSILLKQYGERCADSAKLHLRYRKRGTDIFVGTKKYKAPEDYEGADGTFTLESGKNFSFFYDGLFDGNISMTDADYKNGLYNYINANYSGRVFAVSSVGMWYEIPHFEVMAK